MPFLLDHVFPFTSLGRSGTGSVETITHGLGFIPGMVLVVLRDTLGVQNQYTIGAVTSQTVQITVTNNGVYDLYLL